MSKEKNIQEILDEQEEVFADPAVTADPEISDHVSHAHKKDPFALEKIEKTKNGFFGFFITRIRLTLLVIAAIVLLGGLALASIPREADPEVKIPIAVVTTPFPGASPADVENLVTEEIESKIEELDSIRLVTSSSVLGLSSVTVEFEAEADLEDSIRSLKDKILEVRGLPDDAEDPIVTEVRVDDTPIITFSLAGELKESELKQLGEKIQDELEKIPGVSEVPLLGISQREFLVAVNRGELDRLEISINSIVGAIASSNADTPLGGITIDNSNYNLRTVAKLSSLDDLKKIVIANVNGQSVLLEDVAKITDTFAEKSNISRLSVSGQESIPTVSLSLKKKTGGNILNIVDEAKERIEELKEDGTIPSVATVEVSSDYSQFIRDDLRILGMSGVQAVILIFLLLLLALSYKEAAISLIAIPLTFLITIFVMELRGDTLNSLALFALVLSLGLLVDSFIIVLEGIFHNMRIGYTAKESALLSIAHYKNPLLAGTLTTISAFVPMLLVSGILGEYLRVLPITISTALFSSLFVSIIIVPAIATILLKKKNIHEKKKDSPLEKIVTNQLTKWYVVKIDKILKYRKEKLKFIGGILIAFVIALGLLFSPIVKVELFPKVDIDFSLIDVEMPIGTDLESTDKVVRQIEEYLYTRSDIKTFTTSVGSSSNFGSFGNSGSSNEHVANINITFVDEGNRELKSYDINDAMREDLEFITEGKITVREITSGPPTGAPIEVRITGEDLDVLDQLMARLVSELENTEGVIDIESNKEVSPADITFTLRREALAEAGLSVSEVSGFLRTAIFGVTATEISVDDEDVDVVVRFNEKTTDSVEQIQNITISNGRGEGVKLSRLAEFSLEPALASIRHRDFKRAVTVQASLEEGFTPTEIVPQIEKAVSSDVPEGYSYNFGGEVEDIEQSFSELWNAMIVAVILILFILVLQFNSFKKPFIILMELPLMLIGVVIGMLVFQMPFSFSVFLGLISLAGIVVNDAIVLLDKADRNVYEHGMKARQAIANAGATRLQPILLTSITTVFGVLPLTWADEFWFGLSISIIFGITFATILQLFVLPIIYLKLEGKYVLKQLNKKD